MNILNEIVGKTKLRTEKLDINALKRAAKPKEGFLFKTALEKTNISIIAEIKKASPSKGLICADFNLEKIAHEYKAANVDCISVLTEPFFFLGDNSYIEKVKKITQKPVLRKDFIISEAQIYESSLLDADCILLICAILDEKKLSRYLEIARGLGLSALVEVHDENEMRLAINSGACIIGVNNRNLKTFNVDFENSLRLKKMAPGDIIFVSESGIKTRGDVQTLEKAGFSACLIGETFMRSENKAEKIKELRGF
ncbi:MAG: indole-3-glycerol phosphate synthase TrpC [Candidatus Gastranaerophilales bacterium]|nr:indole-3-glycerol phosphate synthase TrpC [Candidatus Gastranaerophilales bacterium]